MSLDSDLILDALRCPICVDIPENEIYQCVNGHFICRKCALKITVCPQCRGDLKVKGELIRNRVAEEILAKLVKACSFHQEGCLVRRVASQIAIHETECIYNPRIVQPCRYFGFNCDFWSDVLSPEKTTAHLKTHNVIFHSGNSVLLHYVCFNSEANERVMRKNGTNFGLWLPVVLKSSLGSSFLVVSKIWGHDQSKLVTWTCVQLDNLDSKLEVEFVVWNPNKKTRSIKWKEAPFKLLELKLESTPFGIPMNQLEKSYTNEYKNLMVSINIRSSSSVQDGASSTQNFEKCFSDHKRIMLGVVMTL